MRKLLFILSFFLLSITGYAQGIIVNGHLQSTPFTPDTVARFLFTLSNNPVSGYTQLIGAPPDSVITKTGDNSITASTLNSTDAYWNAGGISPAGGYLAENTANMMFPAETGSGWFFHSTSAAPSGGNLRIGGLVAGANYTFYIRVNRTNGNDNRRCRITCIDNGGSEIIDSINASPTSSTSGSNFNQVNSGGTVVWFESKVPVSGEIYFKIERESATWTFGYISAMIIVQTSAGTAFIKSIIQNEILVHHRIDNHNILCFTNSRFIVEAILRNRKKNKIIV